MLSLLDFMSHAQREFRDDLSKYLADHCDNEGGILSDIKDVIITEDGFGWIGEDGNVILASSKINVCEHSGNIFTASWLIVEL